MRCYGEWKDFKISKFGSSWGANQTIEMWNKTFEPNYIEFRRMLRNMTIENVKKEFENFFFLDEFQDYQDGCLYYGIDEDDFVCKNFVAKILQVANSETQIYCWNHLRINHMDVSVCEDKIWGPCNGSNYLLKYPFDSNVMERHGQASKFLKQKETKKLILKENLTLKNHNISSLSLWRDNPTRKDMIEHYEMYMNVNAPTNFEFENEFNKIKNVLKEMRIK